MNYKETVKIFIYSKGLFKSKNSKVERFTKCLFYKLLEI